MPSIPALILKGLLVLNRAHETTSMSQLTSTDEKATASYTVSLKWPQYTQVVPTSQQQPWAGGDGGDKAEANFVIGQGGFQLETFQLVIWSSDAPWSYPRTSPPIDRANCTIYAIGQATSPWDFHLLPSPPYVRRLSDSQQDEGVVSVGCLRISAV